MPVFVSITEDKVKVARGTEAPGPTFEEIPGMNAKFVFEAFGRAKNSMPDTHSKYYHLLKAGKTVRMHRNNQIADSIIFAATFNPEENLMVASTPKRVDERDILADMEEAERMNEAWDLLYKS